VFLVLFTNLVVIIGALMYVVEGPDSGFTSVPRGIYWAVVTVSTVGFGDITPITPLGQSIAAVVMLLGYCLIIVPTALVSAELALGVSGETQISRCRECGLLEHPGAASFCHRCGHNLHGGPMNSPFGD
jgi:voltage-gated potassium channel